MRQAARLFCLKKRKHSAAKRRRNFLWLWIPELLLRVR